jgi:hypothetical protein
MPLDGSILATFERQSVACTALGSPFTGRVCAVLGAHLTSNSRFGARIVRWPATHGSDALALRAAGALNALARSGKCPELTAAYPPHNVDDKALWAGISAAIAVHDWFLHDYLDSPPQTNEVARSGSLLGGALHLAASTGLPLDIYEIGASAGLNLGFDRYHYDLSAATWGSDAEGVTIPQGWTGPLPPLDTKLSIWRRQGCDQNPLDPSTEETRNRLLAYCWPDQSARIARLEAALLSMARHGPRIVKADAADWVETHFAAPAEPGIARVLMHSIVWQYLSPAIKARITSAIERAGADATPNTPVAWLRVEPDETDPKPYANVLLTIWPTGETRNLGQADFHGRSTHWL